MRLVKWKCDVPNCTPKDTNYSKLTLSKFSTPSSSRFATIQIDFYFCLFFNNIFKIFMKSYLVFAMFIKKFPLILEKKTLFGNELTMEFNTLIAFSSKLFGKILKTFGSFLI